MHELMNKQNYTDQCGMWVFKGHRIASNQNHNRDDFHGPIKLKFNQIPSKEELT